MIADGDLAIEATGAQQGGIENLGPVSGRHDDDRPADVGLEAVDLGQKLVERLFTLLIAADAAHAAAALADGVDLIDEDDGGRRLPLLIDYRLIAIPFFIEILMQ